MAEETIHNQAKGLVFEILQELFLLDGLSEEEKLAMLDKCCCIAEKYLFQVVKETKNEKDNFPLHVSFPDWQSGVGQ